MFGYVLINKEALSPQAFARYQASYCGLCRRLGRLHGLLGRLTLSYDLTFLDILLSSLYEGESELCEGCARCPAHPLRPQCWRASAPADYCADLSIALHYYAAADKWRDDRSLTALALMGLLRGRKRRVEARRPAQCTSMRTELAELSRLEKANCQEPDAAAACFGRLMAALFDYRDDRWRGELRAMGMALGKFIYLLDAADDLAKDRKKHHYNPLYRFSETEGWQQALREGLEGLMAQCAAAFRILPCVDDADILENILYSGVWLRWPFPQEKPPEAAAQD